MSYTYTFALLEVSKETFEEIEKKLKDSGWFEKAVNQVDGKKVLDMHGLALVAKTELFRCPICGGRGSVITPPTNDDVTCKRCKGTGEV